MKVRLWVPVILWMTAIFTLSSIPGKDIPEVGLPHIDKLAHFIEYAILGFLVMRAFSNSKTGISRPVLATLAVSAAVLFAATDEWHQSFIPGRFTDIIDLTFDFIGSMVGVYIYKKK